MKKKTRKHLALGKQTIRDLVSHELTHAVGGGSFRCGTTNDCTVTCACDTSKFCV